MHIIIRYLWDWFNKHVCFPTVKECVDNLSREDDKENLVASLWGAERCLRVLESVSLILIHAFDLWLSCICYLKVNMWSVKYSEFEICESRLFVLEHANPFTWDTKISIQIHVLFSINMKIICFHMGFTIKYILL